MPPPAASPRGVAARHTVCRQNLYERVWSHSLAICALAPRPIADGPSPPTPPTHPTRPPCPQSGGSKPAKLETGAVIQVPLFINQGERIKVDTRSDSYLSRAN